MPWLSELDGRIAAGATLRSVFASGYVFGLAFYLIGIHWMLSMSSVAITVPWLKYPAWAMSGAYLALYPGVIAVGVALAVRRARVPFAFAFPVVSIVVEEWRASGELGFPWFQPGYTQHAYAPVLQLASLGSVSLVTLWLLAVNVLMWRAWRRRDLRSAAFAAVLLAFPWAWGSAALRAAPRAAAGPAVGLIQGNVSGAYKWAGHHEREILRTFLDLSERAAADSMAPGLVVWPETATGGYLRKQLAQLLDIVDFSARRHVTVFSGFPDYELGPDGAPRYFNAAGSLPPSPKDPAIYAKRHLVPFGERMPFEWLIPALAKVELGQAEWTPGRESALFSGGTGRFGCLICFEAIFPELAREDVRAGATWLVNLTNDEWFGPSAALYQHAAMAVFRSAENHVPLVRVANTGLTLVTDASGRVIAKAPVWKPEVLVARLAPPGPRTLFTRVGDWPGIGCVVLAALMAALGFGRALTSRRRGS